MSYAEQIFNQMGVNALIYANDLAFFGFDSYVYKNYDLMMKVIKSPVALDNSVVAYYAMIWCKENRINFTNYAEVGQTISFYHNGLGLNITLDIADKKNNILTLVSHDIDFSMRPSICGDKLTVDSSTDTTPAETKLYANWQSLQWLNSKEKYGNWWSKKYSNDNFDASSDSNDRTMLGMCGFLYGMDDKFYNSIKNVDNKKVHYLKFSDLYSDLKLFSDNREANGGLVTNMRKTSKFWAETYTDIPYSGVIGMSVTSPLRSTSKKVQDTLTGGLQYNISNWISGGGIFDIDSVSEGSNVVNGSGQNQIMPIVYKICIQY